uniref:Uncharacterized protein n=1 Tax=viral metagenome TaxID=1070528 RepID=A0A6C0D458_9ZZZZ
MLLVDKYIYPPKDNKSAYYLGIIFHVKLYRIIPFYNILCSMPFCVTCADAGKKTSASFNSAGTTPAKFCAAHKLDGMVNVINKLCAHVDENGQGCIQRPSFNIIGGKPMYCSLHKSEEMVNSLEKRCEGLCVNGSLCGKVRMFNFPGKKGGLFCSDHKEEGMVNVTNKMCEDCGAIVPSYGYPGKSKTHCAQHKKEGMVDLKHTKCAESKCMKSPSYGYVGKTATHCVEHKLDEMIDVKHSKCEYTSPNTGRCTRACSFNYIGETSSRFCSEHKLDLMVDVTRRKCGYDNCNRRPLYNTMIETKPLYCILHKLPDMIDVSNKKCLSEWCVNRAYKPSNEGYCNFCFLHLFPEKPQVRNYKTKEFSVVEYIKSRFSDVTWITDKRVQDGCSKRRPDLFLDMGSHIIIVEVDENQHIDYDCSCENKRLMEISQDVGHRNIVFIRFNPDQYFDKNNTKVPSCWTINKQGILEVNKNNSKRWNDRLKALASQVQYWIDNKSDKTIECIQLFYDEY